MLQFPHLYSKDVGAGGEVEYEDGEEILAAWYEIIIILYAYPQISYYISSLPVPAPSSQCSPYGLPGNLQHVFFWFFFFYFIIGQRMAVAVASVMRKINMLQIG